MQTKWQLACKHDEYGDANTPHITFKWVFIAFYYLRGHIMQSACESEEGFQMSIVIVFDCSS